MLVDTGAFHNRCGEYWLGQVQSALEQAQGHLDPQHSKIIWERLDVPHPIRGVANEQVQAKWKVKVPIGLPGGGLTYYQCLYLEKNNTPGLLGMNAMKKANTILDLRPGQMFMYSGASGNAEIVIPNSSNYKKFKLIESPGGHIMLSCTNYYKAEPVHSQVSRKES